jgi:hypothetical protein
VDVPVAFPADFDYEVELDNDLSAVRELRLTVTLPEDCPRGTTMLCYLKDAQWNWYQHEPQGSLKSGRTNLVRIDMSPGAERWIPRGHSREWDGYVGRQIRGLGIKLFNRTGWTGSVRIERIQGRAGVGVRPQLAVADLRAAADNVPCFGLYELSFDLTRVYENPFDPEEIDVRATFTAPSGKAFEQFGFHTRDYVRSQSPLGYERLTPVGRSFWKLRFTPNEPGSWKVAMTLFEEKEWKKAVADVEAFNKTAAAKDRKAPPKREEFVVKVRPLAFGCTPSPAHGFLRVDPKDPFYFSYQDGTFFYPIGQMLRSPVDLRPPFPAWDATLHEGEGTFLFDRMMGKLSASGVNFVRVWMGVWWVGLEAPREYAPGYAGLGQYNMANAWKLDHIFDEARRLGLTVKLNLNNHGQFTRDIDHEWYENCYNEMNGGMLKAGRPYDFWTDKAAKEQYKKRLRYVVARWAYSPELMGWELWNEVDLTEGFDAQTVADWHRDFARHLKQIDPFKHMISTHFCKDERAGAVYSLREIEFTPGDLYQANIVSAMRNVWLEKKSYQKPTFISEYGVGYSADQIETNFHGGLWSSTVVPMAGTAMFWWWNFIDVQDLYSQYKPVAEFNRGEDRRNKDWQLTSAQVRVGNDLHGELRVLGRQNPTEAHLWVYDSPIFSDNDGNRYRKPPTFTGATLCVPSLQAGSYRVEFWDTYKGSVIGTPQVLATDGEMLRVPMPPVARDIAVKVKRLP